MKFINAITGEILENINTDDYIALNIYDGDVEIIKKGEEYLYVAFEYSLDRGEMLYNEFLENCKAYGGNWANMIISGIKTVFPRVYDTMPDKNYNFIELIELIEMCGVKIEKGIDK